MIADIAIATETSILTGIVAMKIMSIRRTTGRKKLSRDDRKLMAIFNKAEMVNLNEDGTRAVFRRIVKGKRFKFPIGFQPRCLSCGWYPPNAQYPSGQWWEDEDEAIRRAQAHVCDRLNLYYKGKW